MLEADNGGLEEALAKNAGLEEALARERQESSRGVEHKDTMVQVMESLTQENQAQRAHNDQLQLENARLKSQADELRLAIEALTKVKAVNEVDEGTRKKLKELEAMLRLRDAALAQAKEELQAKKDKPQTLEYPDLTDEVKKRNEEIVGLRAALEQLMVEQHQAQQIMPNSSGAGNTTPRGQISGAAATQPSPGTRMNNIKTQLETGEKQLDAQSLAEQVAAMRLQRSVGPDDQENANAIVEAHTDEAPIEDTAPALDAETRTHIEELEEALVQANEEVEALKLLIEDKVEDKAQDNTMMNESIEGMMQSTRTCTAFVELNQACIAEIESIMNK